MGYGSLGVGHSFSVAVFDYFFRDTYNADLFNSYFWYSPVFAVFYVIPRVDYCGFSLKNEGTEVLFIRFCNDLLDYLINGLQSDVLDYSINADCRVIY